MVVVTSSDKIRLAVDPAIERNLQYELGKRIIVASGRPFHSHTHPLQSQDICWVGLCRIVF